MNKKLQIFENCHAQSCKFFAVKLQYFLPCYSKTTDPRMFFKTPISVYRVTPLKWDKL